LQKESRGNEKNEKEKSIGKNGQVSKILKQWVLRCPRKKREKDSP
jgi:hypothetical protein